MFSKGSSLILALSIFGLSACSLDIGEEPAKENIVSIDPDSSECLAGAFDDLRAYFAGSLKAAQQVKEIAGCSSRALQYFMDNVQGAEPDRYTPIELRAFLEKYFLGGTKISDELLSQAMKVKQAVIGGSIHEISPDELRYTQDILKIVGEELFQLHPYMPISTDRAAEVDEKFLDQMVTQLKSSAIRMVATFRGGGSRYLFRDFEKFLMELEKLDPDQDSIERNQLLRKYLPLFQDLKSIALGSTRKEIEAGEWPTVIESLVEWYSVFLRGVHLFASRDNGEWKNYRSIQSGSGLRRFKSLGNRILFLADRAIQRNLGQRVTFEDLGILFMRLEELGLFPYPLDPSRWAYIQAGTLSRAVEILIQKVFQEGPQAQGLSQTTIGVARNALERWSKGQELLQQLFWHADCWKTQGEDCTGQPPSRSWEYFDQLEFRSSELYRALGGVRPDLGWEESDSVFQHWRKTLLDVHMKSFHDGKINCLTEQCSELHSFFGLSQRNWLRILIDLFMEGYGQDRERVRKIGLTVEETEEFYFDLYQLGVEIRLFDPNYTDTARKRFREADLFTFHANGDNHVSSLEGVDILSLMVSSKYMSGDIHRSIASRCPFEPLPDYVQKMIDEGKTSRSKFFQDQYGIPLEEQDRPMDRFGLPNIWDVCFRDQFYIGFKEFFGTALPDLVAYKQSLSRSEWSKMRTDYEASTRRIPSEWEESIVYNSGDMDSFVMIFHYLESIFVRFDQIRDGVLIDAEAALAYEQVFREKIKEAIRSFDNGSYINLDKDSEVRNVFYFLLKHGRAPNSLYELYQVKYRSISDVHADRSRVFEIFKMIGELNAPKAEELVSPQSLQSRAQESGSNRIEVE